MRFIPWSTYNPLLCKSTFKLWRSCLLTWLILLSDLRPWLYTDFWLYFCSLKTDRWDGLKSSFSFLQKTMGIVSSGVKAIKRWPWLLRWFESLIKSLIEPNAATVFRPMCFHLIYHQLLDQHNIAINLLNLCPFPEPNSRVLELCAHSLSSSILQSVDSSQEKKYVGHPIGTHRPQPATCYITCGSVNSCIHIQYFNQVHYVENIHHPLRHSLIQPGPY